MQRELDSEEEEERDFWNEAHTEVKISLQNILKESWMFIEFAAASH